MSSMVFFFRRRAFGSPRFFSSSSFSLFFSALPEFCRIASRCASRHAQREKEKVEKTQGAGERERKKEEACNRWSSSSPASSFFFSLFFFTITILYSLPGNIQCHRLEKTTPISRKPRVSRARKRENERKKRKPTAVVSRAEGGRTKKKWLWEKKNTLRKGKPQHYNIGLSLSLLHCFLPRR